MKIRTTSKRIRAAVTSLAVLAMTTPHCFASGSFGSSTLATGIKNLVNDVSGWLVIICPIVGGVAVFFFIRKSMADEQDGKMWQKRAVNAIICGVAGMLVSGIINMLSGYF